MTGQVTRKLNFVTCASNLKVLSEHLLSSPCLRNGGHSLTVFFNAPSAAHGFNAAMIAASNTADLSQSNFSWLVWAHQDVFLPQGWDLRFNQALDAALLKFPKLTVVGAYGVVGAGGQSRRAGHVLDRGTLLKESMPLPCLVDSLDELMFAVRVDANLRLDPALGFDFYATDLVLQAQAKGLQCAVVDAFCEHWSSTPASGEISNAVVKRIQDSASVFEHKWAARLPVTTPCFPIDRPGSVASFIAAHVVLAP
jgi:hypothetical protein